MSTVPVTKTQKSPRASSRTMRLFDPLGSFEKFLEDVNRRWNERFAGMPLLSSLATGESADWAPAVDVFEEKGNIVLKADLPGVKKKDIEVSLEDGDLVVRGSRSHEHEIKDEDCYRLERSQGSFFRRMALPADLKASQVKAKFSDGVLEVRFPKPKAPPVTGESIKIQ